MDILSAAAVRVPCPQCGEAYSVPLRDILQSHEIMHQGCPTPAETECPPAFQSRLASQEAIAKLEQAWGQLEREAKRDGGELVLMDSLGAEASSASRNQRLEQPREAKRAGKRKNPRRAS